MLTIQPSVFIWTVICFCLLMLILNRLLFRPMLRFMDERQEKVNRAAAKKEENRSLLAEAEAALEQRKRKNADLTAANEQERIAAAQKEADQRLAQARRESERELQTQQEHFAAERRNFDAGLEQGLEELAQAFVSKFVS